MSTPKCVQIPEKLKCLTSKSGRFKHSINGGKKTLNGTFKILPDGKKLIVSFDRDKNQHIKEKEFQNALNDKQGILKSARNGNSEGWRNAKTGGSVPSIKIISFTR